MASENLSWVLFLLNSDVSQVLTSFFIAEKFEGGAVMKALRVMGDIGKLLVFGASIVLRVAIAIATFLIGLLIGFISLLFFMES